MSKSSGRGRSGGGRSDQSRRAHAGRGGRGKIAEVMPPKLFKALSDPNRIAILARLADCRGPCSVSEVAGCCSVDLSVVSRHLAVLRDAGVLGCARNGKEVYYWVQASALVETLRAMADAVETCCPQKTTPAGGLRKPSSRGRRKP